MLTQDALIPLAISALPENGCAEVYLMGNVVTGLEPGDPADAAETMQRIYDVEYARRFRYPDTAATAGDRNVHQMSGRVE